MNRLTSLLVLLCICATAFGQQEIKDYVKTHTVPIVSINPSDTNFNDLKEFGKAIGDARVVMLGEQDHGDAPAFLAKTRLIKYLHEQKGFKVLAMESDFFSLNPGWDELKKDKPSISLFLKQHIFGVWSTCDAFQPFIQYVTETFETANPLQVTGIDVQMYFRYTYNNLSRQLDSVLKHYQLPVVSTAEYEAEIRPLIQTFHNNTGTRDTAFFSKRERILRDIRSQLGAKTQPADFWLMVIDNLIQLNEINRFEKSDYWKNRNARDLQMARNLAWLCDVKYPGQKIIVWAHNGHISKHSGHYPEDFLNNARWMGHVFTEDPARMNSTYILGFTAAEGTAGRMGTQTYSLPKLDKNGFESWIDPSFQQAFTDFRPYNSAKAEKVESFSMAGSIKGPALHSVHKAQWTKIFDGVFYIRKMYPCESIAK